MYCIKCGVKLSDTEEKCPLCNTAVYHPDFVGGTEAPLYPKGRVPKSGAGKRGLNGAVIILFMIPLIVCFFADLLLDGELYWFGYAAGALVVLYTAIALPLWFSRPNPVIFVPCNFAAVGLYLLYINIATGGAWFLSFAFPMVAGLCLIVCTVVTLCHYLRAGRLYIFGGAFMALGALMLLCEFLLGVTFGLAFIGWSVYPLTVLFLFGGLLIYLGINTAAREMLERKLFF